MTKERYNKRYTANKAAFGDAPEQLLVDYYKQINNTGVVLDVGAGQGRHSLYLAENGYGVEALEPSEVGLKQIEKAASEANLPVFCSLGELDGFEPKVDHYSAILLFGIIQILKPDEIKELLIKVDQWTKKDSLIFITAFTTDEPSYDKHKQDDQELGPNSFEDKTGFIRSYLKPGELKELFKGWEEIYYNERLTDKHHHGDGNLHYHAVVEAVFRTG